MRVHLQCLGGVAAQVDGAPAHLPTRRSAALLGYLATTRRRHTRSHLAALFWPDTDPSVARGNLRVVLSNLRQAVPGALVLDRDGVELAAEVRDGVDVARFERVADLGLARTNVSPGEADELLETAHEAYRGELLADLDLSVGAEFETWLSAARAELDRRHRRVLEALVDRQLAAGATSRTVSLTERLVAEDDYDEGAMARLVQAVAGTGRRAEALRRFRAWERTLAEELGLRPTAELLEVVAQVRDGRPVEGGGGAAALESRLPLFTRLVGRDAELEDLARLLEDGERLVTVVGPAGVGKTSTVVALAHQLHVRTRVPVVHVDLVEATGARDVLRRILTELGDERPTPVDVAGVRDRLRDRRVVLVLDNFEHLLDDREVVARLHASCPTVTLLVTSRSPLRLRSEHVYTLAPLEVPSPTTVDPDALLGTSAVLLFLERARRSGVWLSRSRDDLASVARACRVLDGIPLAIELAAARLPMLGLPGLVAALEDDDAGWRLAVLGRGPDGPAGDRHRSVRDAVAWSYALLSERAEELFRRLSVFAGTFDLDAVLGVCSDDGTGREDVVDALAELVDFHLVTRTESQRPRVRFRMLVTMRALATELLTEHDEAEVLAERHARHYLGAVGTARDARGDGDWLRAVRPDVGNLVAALDWCHDRDRPVEALRLLDRLGPFWRTGGGSSQGLELLSRAVDDARDLAADDELAACAVWRAGLLAERDGEDAAADVREVLDHSVRVLESSRRRDDATRCLAEAVNVATVIGDTDRAVSLARRLQQRTRTPTERWWALTAHLDLAMLAHHAGDDDHALGLIAEAIHEARRLDRPIVELRAWMWVAMLEAADRVPIDEDPPALEDLLTLADDLDDHHLQVWLLVSLGTQAIFADRADDAAVRFERSMTIARRTDYRHGLAFTLMGAVALVLAAGDLAAAARLHGVLHPHLDDLRNLMPRTYHDAYLAVTAHFEELARTDETVAGALAAGRALPWAEAVAEAHLFLHERAGAAHARVPGA